MSDNEPTGINRAILDRIPNPWNETFERKDLPSKESILTGIHKVHPSDWAEKGEIQRARENNNYIGLTDQEMDTMLPTFIDSLLDEMYTYETLGREPLEKRLTRLKQIAPFITRVIDRSAPGNYYHLNKADKYQS